MSQYYQLWLSAEDAEQAQAILTALIEKKLVVGGTVFNGPSQFWWEGKKIDMDYYYVMAFTVAAHRRVIEEEFERVSQEEVPMASFVAIDGNQKFLQYIFDNTKNPE